MKRYLYLVRHATAEDGSFFMSDFDRQLTPEGTIEAARMGKFLFDKGIKLDFVASSSAARAFQTARIMSEQMKYDEANIATSRSLYEDGAKGYLASINNAPESATSIMVCGHNPDISFFAEYLTHSNIGNMNKGAVVTIEFENINWNEVSARTGKFISYNEPKS
jgi:phosphohistidine phosphatase